MNLRCQNRGHRTGLYLRLPFSVVFEIQVKYFQKKLSIWILVSNNTPTEFWHNENGELENEGDLKRIIYFKRQYSAHVVRRHGWTFMEAF